MRVTQVAAQNFGGIKALTKEGNKQNLLIGLYVVLFEG